jgi:hypothetical protein
VHSSTLVGRAATCTRYFSERKNELKKREVYQSFLIIDIYTDISPFLLNVQTKDTLSQKLYIKSSIIQPKKLREEK